MGGAAVGLHDETVAPPREVDAMLDPVPFDDRRRQARARDELQEPALELAAG
jgi:hypothetical protein